MRSFKGFTLTELMVALAVIGILVAVVTPAIMKTRPNKNKMMVKKTFYTTEQIVANLINDARLYPDMREACDDKWAENNPDADPDLLYCAWGFDYDNEVTYEGEEYEGGRKFMGLFATALNVSRSDDCSNDICSIIYTTDGVRWDLGGTNGAWTKTDAGDSYKDSGIGHIIIDVNGDDAPNCREGGDDGEGNTCDGNSDDFDRYVIDVYANGKLNINANDTKAIEYATINTSIRDNL